MSMGMNIGAISVLEKKIGAVGMESIRGRTETIYDEDMFKDISRDQTEVNSQMVAITLALGEPNFYLTYLLQLLRDLKTDIQKKTLSKRFRENVEDFTNKWISILESQEGDGIGDLKPLILYLISFNICGEYGIRIFSNRKDAEELYTLYMGSKDFDYVKKHLFLVSDLKELFDATDGVPVYDTEELMGLCKERGWV